MAKKEVPQLLQYWLILELSEYFTLRNRGLLHTIPTSRYVDSNATYHDWYRALPPNWDNGRYFVVRAIRPVNADVALHFQDVETTTFYTLQPEDSRNVEVAQPALEFLRNRLGPTLTADTPFSDIISRIRYAQEHYPYGLALIPLADYEAALRNHDPNTIFAPANAVLPADLCLDLNAWRRQLPDFEVESQVLVLELIQPVPANTAISRQALRLSPVYPLTKRGEEILRIEKPAITLETPLFEKTYVRPVLLERAEAERHYNAQKLAGLISSKPSEEMLTTCQQLERAWEIRQKRRPAVSPNPDCRSFWDYLLDYDRTGEKALAIVNTDQGYLQDLLQVIGCYLKYSRLTPGLIQKEDFNRIVQSWSTLANDAQLSDAPFKIFTSKASKSHAETVKYVSGYLDEGGLKVLLTGFIFLRLRRELGDLEQSLTHKKVQDYGLILSKNKGEMYAAFYALGLVFSFKNFVALYEEYAVQPVVLRAKVKATLTPSLFSTVVHTDITSALIGSANSADTDSNTQSWDGDAVKPAE